MKSQDPKSGLGGMAPGLKTTFVVVVVVVVAEGMVLSA